MTAATATRRKTEIKREQEQVEAVETVPASTPSAETVAPESPPAEVVETAAAPTADTASANFTFHDLGPKLAVFRQKREKEYRALVSHCVAGHPFDEHDLQDVSKLLSDMGKTEADLANDVQVLKKRWCLRNDIDAFHAVEQERADLQAKVAELNSKHEEANRRHLQEVRPLIVRLEQIQVMRTTAKTAELELRKTAPEAKKQKMLELNQQQQAINHERKKLRDAIGIQQQNVADSQARAAGASTQMANEYLKDGRRAKCRIAEYEAALAKLDADFLELGRRGSALSATFLQP